MSVSSRVIICLSVIEQIDVAKTYKYRLTGRGQAEVDVTSLMEIDNEKKKIKFWNCFCKDDFTEIVPDFCTFIAKSVPSSDFNCTADFLNESGGETLEYKIDYKGGKLNIGFYDSEEEDDDEYEDKYDELVFVISGKLKYFENRQEFEDYILYSCDGGDDYQVTNKVSSKTSYLICNDKESTSSKVKKARELGIPVIDEEEFIRRYGDPEEFLSKEENFIYNTITIV